MSERGTRYVEARVSVSSSPQARTLEEQRRMDEGEMEQRYVDMHARVFRESAPKGAGDAALDALRRAADLNRGRRRLARARADAVTYGAPGSSRGRGARLARLAVSLNPRWRRVRAAEHAPRGPFRLLERRHAPREIVERGVGVEVGALA